MVAFLTFKNRTYRKDRYLISILLAVIEIFIPLLSHSQSVTEVLKYLQDDLPEIEKYPNAMMPLFLWGLILKTPW